MSNRDVDVRISWGDQSNSDRLITLMTEMAEDETATGTLNYSGDVVVGRYTATIDGRRVTLYLDPPAGE